MPFCLCANSGVLIRLGAIGQRVCSSRPRCCRRQRRSAYVTVGAQRIDVARSFRALLRRAPRLLARAHMLARTHRNHTPSPRDNPPSAHPRVTAGASKPCVCFREAFSCDKCSHHYAISLSSRTASAT
ncbi:hypothetical protein PHLGIDRAFT_255186 [Phlebiopsis gigantea 11061_1 CR5-6]|uniref:Uncharacterized protein n=1 Tax=Phlebiopsis gigantea (strain 11061_1 CR5-6) TaxID=745531 RepID=A0A0C3PD12_PHLG1|nr:hypothetical protein PHLGIDRAFT_255186 [Phlebiopsis gigantea 11061_1 CR5-6]